MKSDDVKCLVRDLDAAIVEVRWERVRTACMGGSRCDQSRKKCKR